MTKLCLLSGNFMDWQAMMAVCTLQFKLNPIERRVPKQMKCHRKFASEQAPPISLQCPSKDTKVPVNSIMPPNSVLFHIYNAEK